MTEQEQMFKATLLSNNPQLNRFLVTIEYIKRNQVWMIEMDPSEPGDLLMELRVALPNQFHITQISATSMENAVIYVKGEAKIVSRTHT